MYVKPYAEPGSLQGGRETTKRSDLKAIAGILKTRKLKIRDARLYKIQREDIAVGTILSIPRKHDTLLLIPIANMMSLVGQKRKKSVPIPFSLLFGIGKLCDVGFNERILDQIILTYMREEVAVIVSGNWLFERLR